MPSSLFLPFFDAMYVVAAVVVLAVELYCHVIVLRLMVEFGLVSVVLGASFSGGIYLPTSQDQQDISFP